MKITVLKLRSVIIALAAVAVITAIAVSFEKITSTGTDGIEVPIIMYHSVLKDTSRSGRYIITPSQIEEDLKYLKKNGYSCVFVRDLIKYAEGVAELPEKPIILTFDDGHYNNEVYVVPLLEKYNQKAVISVVGKYTDEFSENPDENANYAYLSWKNINELVQSGRIEIGNHSYDMHSVGKRKGTHKMSGETLSEYSAALSEDLIKMQELCVTNLGFAPCVFTYPFGSVSTESYDIVKKCGFAASLSCEEGINCLSGERDELYMLKRCIRTNTRSVRDILENAT